MEPTERRTWPAARTNEHRTRMLACNFTFSMLLLPFYARIREYNTPWENKETDKKNPARNGPGTGVSFLFQRVDQSLLANRTIDPE